MRVADSLRVALEVAEVALAALQHDELSPVARFKLITGLRRQIATIREAP